MDMVSLVVHYYLLVNITNDHPQINFGVRGCTGWALAEEIVHCVFIVRRGGYVLPGINTVNIGQKDVSGGIGNSHFVLLMQSELKIIKPVAPVIAVIRQDRIIEKYAKPMEVLINTV